jgi:hypothetical protein
MQTSDRRQGEDKGRQRGKNRLKGPRKITLAKCKSTIGRIGRQDKHAEQLQMITSPPR